MLTDYFEHRFVNMRPLPINSTCLCRMNGSPWYQLPTIVAWSRSWVMTEMCQTTRSWMPFEMGTEPKPGIKYETTDGDRTRAMRADCAAAAKRTPKTSTEKEREGKEW